MKRKVQRKVLIILSNRLAPLEPAKHLEILCDDEGSVLSQRKLRAVPAKPVYDEVWQNDEGRTSFDSTYRFKRHYGHRLQKPKA
jgi:hypothetical protein